MPFGLTKRFQKSISVRIALLFCVTFTVALTFTFVITYFQTRYSLENSGREVVSSKLRECAAILSADGVRGLKEFLTQDKNRVLNAPYLVRVLNREGETIYFKPSVQEKNFDFDRVLQKKTAPANELGWQALQAIDDEDKFIILTDKATPNFFLQVGKSSEDREEILGNILEVFAGMSIMFAALSGALGLWYAKKSLAPLRDLLVAIHKIESGDFTQRVPIRQAQDELNDLGTTFNRMIARVEKLIQMMKESLDNVAHDIRTPLTRIRSVAEDALLSNDPPSLKNALEDCAESASNVSDLVAQLLSIAEAEAGTLQLNRVDSDIRKLLEEVIEIYDFVAQEKHISVEFTSGNTLVIANVDRKRMKQVFGNLLDNALKFSPPHSKVEIEYKLTDSFVEVQFTDKGPGISPTELGRIWDRLYRGDKSRSTEGLGLGLSIVKSIVVAHDGVVLAFAPETGSRFVVRLPLRANSLC